MNEGNGGEEESENVCAVRVRGRKQQLIHSSPAVYSEPSRTKKRAQNFRDFLQSSGEFFFLISYFSSIEIKQQQLQKKKKKRKKKVKGNTSTSRPEKNLLRTG